jgi:hypothetical protein
MCDGQYVACMKRMLPEENESKRKPDKWRGRMLLFGSDGRPSGRRGESLCFGGRLLGAHGLGVTGLRSGSLCVGRGWGLGVGMGWGVKNAK